MLERFEFKGQAIRMEKRANNIIWVCLTDMAKASGKQASDWSRLKNTQEFLVELESVRGNPVTETVQGGQPEKQGTWGLEEVALDFAGWCSVSFKIWMLDKIKTLMKEGSVSLYPKPTDLSRKDILLLALEAEEEKLKFQAEVERQKLIIALKDETIEAQQEQITEWHPLVENYKQFLDADGLISFGEAGKMLQTGRNRLITVLRLYGFLLLEKNEPLQKWMKYFQLKVKVRNHPSADGTYKSDVVTLFTPEGFNRVIKIMVGKAGSQEKLVEYLQKPAKLQALMTERVEEKKDEATHALEAVYDDIVNFA
jgi:phage antirepressor YoqD-like protein